MARLVVSSDWHIDRRQRGWDRSDEVLAKAAEVVAHANAIGASLSVFCGDLIEDAHDPDHRVWTLLARVKNILDRAQMPWVLIGGNHDVVDVEGCRSALAPLERPEDPARIVVEQPSLLRIAGVCLLCMPHISSAHIDGDVGEYVERRARELLDEWREHERGRPLIVVSHLELEDVQYGGKRRGEVAPFLPSFLREPPVKAVLQGHLHTPATRGIVHVVGSLVRLDFSESRDDKRFIVLEI